MRAWPHALMMWSTVMTAVMTSVVPSGGAALSGGIGDGAGGYYALRPRASEAFLMGSTATASPELSIRENRVVRVTGAGAMSPGWPAEGVAPTGGPGRTGNTLLVADGAGGVIVVWDDWVNIHPRVLAQRLDPAGARSWGTGGVVVASGPGFRSLESALADGTGGVLIGWKESGADPDDLESDLQAQRLTAGGAVANGWAPGGVAVCGATGEQRDLRLASNGAGGLIACWYDGRGFNPATYIQSIDGAGVPQWTADGIPAGIYPPADIASDGASGALLTSVTGGFVVVQRCDASGAALWSPGGVPVSVGVGYLVDPRVISDGAGGALVHWFTQSFNPQQSGALQAQRLTSTGAMQAGWPAGGLWIGDSLSFGARHDAIRDGSTGFLFAWTDARYGTVVLASGDTLIAPLTRPRAQRVTAAGAISPGWPGEGVRVSQDEALLTGAELVFVGDGVGGASFAWQDARAGLYGQRLDGSGAKQWNPSDVRLVADAGGQSTPTISSDGSGGALVGWMEAGFQPPAAFARHIDGSGALTGSKTPFGPLRAYLSTLAAPDGAGGTFLACLAYPSIRVQRYDASGAALWTTPTAVDPGSGASLIEGMTSDGAGGVFLLWLDSAYIPTLQHVAADGTMPWPAVQPFATDPYLYTWNHRGTLVTDGAGGVIAVQPGPNGSYTNLWVQRVDASNTALWGATGTAVAVGNRDEASVRATSDGAHGAILTWTGDDVNTNADIWALRVDSTGSVAAGWPADGVTVCGAAGRQLDSDITGDGLGGCLIAWTDARGAVPQAYAQAVSGGGALLWAQDGIPLGPGSGAQYLQQVVADGSGGAIASWMDARGPVWGPRAQRVSPLGALGWSADGIDVGGSGGPEPGGFPEGAVAAGNQFAPVIAPDGVGGAVVAWQEAATPFEHIVRAQKITAGGALAWVGGVTGTLASLVSASVSPEVARLEWWSASGWPAQVQRAQQAGNWRTRGAIRPDGQGRYVFEDRELVRGDRYGYRLALANASGETYAGEVWLTVPQADALALTGASPNPVTDDVWMAFTLRGVGGASLEVFDLGGRRVMSRAFSLPAGAHRLRVARAGELHAGIYLARLREGGESRLRRFVVIR